MPPLEEGNLWIRADMQQDISFDESARLADQIRATLRAYPEITQVVSQMGRPDDGTDVSTFNNIEFLADLRPASQWRAQFHGDKVKLIAAIQQSFRQYPGIDFNFSQNIQDNVEEAMSGVKGENSLKLFGDDFDELTKIAGRMAGIMKTVPGITDVGVFDVAGQPSLLVSIDRAKAARYGLQPQDVNNVVQAAVGGAPVTQIIEGERRFDFTVRYASAISQHAGRDRADPAADAGRQPGSAWHGGRCDAAQRSLHDLSRGRTEIYSRQVQRARARPGQRYQRIAGPACG